MELLIGLIILFIKLQYSDWVLQIFKPLQMLYILILLFYRLYHLYHPQYDFVIIPDLTYTSKDLYISNKVKFRLIYSLLSLGAISI